MAYVINDDCIACQIGEFWFYFIGSEDEDLTPNEVERFISWLLFDFSI